MCRYPMLSFEIDGHLGNIPYRDLSSICVITEEGQGPLDNGQDVASMLPISAGFWWDSRGIDVHWSPFTQRFR